jgi:RNA polymerase sigma factor (sigma-70 family)
MELLRDVSTAELVKRAQAADQAAWNALTARYTNLLWSVARGMRLGSDDAADAVQTTWLRLVERLDTVRDPEHLGSWLATTVRRECLAILRRRVPTPTDSDWDSLPDDDAAPLDAGLLKTEQDSALWRAFRALKPRCQALLRVLMADPPPPYADVAVALDMPVGSIGPSRQRCLADLRRLALP